ncbi:MAG: hypothetical protein HDS11_06740 [Bacteroides sp.]|nr:hypothetical protein [Bacteroides sp.]
MSKSHYLIALLLCGIVGSSQASHYYLQTVEGTLPDTESLLWDFSDADLVGSEFDITVEAQDSLVRIDMPSKSYMFCVTKDSIKRLWSDSRFLILKDSLPALESIANRNEMITSPTAQRGKAYHRDFVLTEGEIQLKPSVYGTIIFPMGDTIQNVRLNKNVTRQVASVSPINYTYLADAPDSIKITRNISTYTWLASGTDFPIARMEIERDSIENRQIGIESHTWIRTDYAYHNEIAESQKAPVITTKPSGLERFGGLNFDATHNDAKSGLLSSLLNNVSISENESEIAIRLSENNFSDGKDYDYKLILTDILGRVIASSTHRGEADWRIARHNLPPGEYLLYISNSSASSSHKIILH